MFEQHNDGANIIQSSTKLKPKRSYSSPRLTSMIKRFDRIEFRNNLTPIIEEEKSNEKQSQLKNIGDDQNQQQEFANIFGQQQSSLMKNFEGIRIQSTVKKFKDDFDVKVDIKKLITELNFDIKKELKQVET